MCVSIIKRRNNENISFISALVITLLLPVYSHADNFCVSDATGLQTALTTASGNGEDDTIQIVQGTYVGSFIYASTEAFSLTVEGGYTGSCASRVVDPANTVLDANETGSVLVFSTPDTNANLEVDGLTLQNGVAGMGMVEEFMLILREMLLFPTIPSQGTQLDMVVVFMLPVPCPYQQHIRKHG